MPLNRITLEPDPKAAKQRNDADLLYKAVKDGCDVFFGNFRFLRWNSAEWVVIENFRTVYRGPDLNEAIDALTA